MKAPFPFQYESDVKVMKRLYSAGEERIKDNNLKIVMTLDLYFSNQ